MDTQDSDPRAVDLLRHWSVRYIVGEWIPHDGRPSEQLHWERLAEWRALTPAERPARGFSAETPPVWDAESYLDGALRRVFKSGRWEVFEVQGYEGPPY
jgi:hypothetical protein